MDKELITRLRSPKVYSIVVLVIAMACFPIFLRGSYVLYVMILIGISAIYSSSWNLLTYSGQASLGHAAFLGIGGFTSALLTKPPSSIPPWLGLFIGGAVASGIGFLVGLTCVRLKEWFLAIVTFGFSVIAGTVTIVLDDFTHGIYGFPPSRLVGSRVQFYYVTLFLAAVSVFLIYMIINSRIGLAFSAIRENELEARTMGVNTTKYKLVAFVISTFFAGLAGALQVHFIRYIKVDIYRPENSFKPLIMSVIGGLGTIEGPIIGSIIITSIESFSPSILDPMVQNLLGPFFPMTSNVGPPIRWIIIGFFLIAIVIFLPKGISSLLRKALKR